MATRLSDIVRVARDYEIEIDVPTGGGSHWKAKKEGYRTYPLVAHNGEKSQIDDRILGKFCKHFDLIRSEFKRRL